MEETTNEETTNEETNESEVSEEETKEEETKEEAPTDAVSESAETDDQGRTLYTATCSDCGNECKVPFEPTEGKPVRCKECFMKNRPQRSFGGGGNRDRNRSFNRGPREEHAATCSECGKDCTVPFKPTQGKPVLCRDCYKKSKGF